MFEPEVLDVDPVLKRVYIGGGDELRVLDASTNTLLSPIETGLSSSISSAADGVVVDTETHTAYVANLGYNTVAVVDLTTDRVLNQITTSSWPHRIAWNSQAHRVYVGGDSVNSTVQAIDERTNRVVATNPTAGVTFALAINPSTNHVYASSEDAANTAILDGATLQPIGSLAGTYVSIAVDPGRGRIYGVSPYDPAIHVFDAANDEPIGTISLSSFGDGLAKIAVDSGTGLLYVVVDVERGMHTAGIAVIDPVTGEKSLIPVGPQASIVDVAMDPITHRIYAADSGGGILWVVSPTQGG